ncbi:MAG: hypothetical protein HYX92_10245 [Chloroflexi bacterium]|nr:hypothetical protein [Chloroflexota bacterium]
MTRPRKSRGNLARRLAYLCKVDLGEAAILASGARFRRLLIGYLIKLSDIERRARLAIPSGGGEEKAKALFDWLWHDRSRRIGIPRESGPQRYASGGNFRLTDVIDAQMGLGETVGNCLGLTLLYNSLGQRLDLPLKAVHLEKAFDRGPHVLSMLPAAGGAIDIENIVTDGFDYQGHLTNPGRVEWGNRDLIAELLVAIGNEQFEQGNLGTALESYEAAFYLSPENHTAELNRLIAASELGRYAS